MRMSEYLEDHIIFLLSTLLGLMMQSLLLYFLGNTISMIVILDVLWCIFFICAFLFDFHKKRKRLQLIEYAKQHLDKKYLLHEVLPKGGKHEEKYYKDLLYIGNKAMIEEISTIQRDRKEYQEYIEQWVHEIKTPIAAMKLWSENQQVERRRDLMQQLERTEHYVEQALYFARSENVEKDFHIHKISLSQSIHESLLENKYLCMSSSVCVELSDIKNIVYSDEKWVTFILNQLIENAVKYRKGQDAYIKISTEEKGEQVALYIEDNGKGICSQDLPRIFEKGFTGQNGRYANQHATGIGLYLCYRLCDALNVELKVASIEGNGTKITMVFKSYKPVSTS